MIEWAQGAGIFGSILLFFLGYGRLQARVSHLEETEESYMRKDSFEPFKDEVLRRLERIEVKQDRFLDGVK